MKMHQNDNLGFTLIEVLIVIAILGLIASALNAAFVEARISARDSKRVQDMRQLSTAINLYLSDFEEYPVAENDIWVPGFDYSHISANGNDDKFIVDLVNNGYIAKSPEAPGATIPHSRYVYIKKNAHRKNISTRNNVCDDTDPEAALIFWLERGHLPHFSPYKDKLVFDVNAICFY